MNKINSFQDLNIWKEGHNLALEIYKRTENFPKKEEYGLVSQIRRAASSVPANIAEGMDRRTTKELITFTYNAKGSLSEVLNHLILSKDLGYMNDTEFVSLCERYNGLMKGINVFLSGLKRKIT